MGYLVYSLFSHAYYRESPGGLEAFAAVFASVLPDIIDKPLAWEYGVFHAGYALGHSVFFAIPLSIAVGMFARSYGRPRAGVAFALAYLIHLPADVVDGYVRDGMFNVWIVLWPLGRDRVPSHSHGHGHGFVEQFSVLFGRYQQVLLSGDPSTYVLAQLALLGATAALWLYDGAPVARELVEWLWNALEPSDRARGR